MSDTKKTLIVIEGLDGSGKATQTKFLTSSLRKFTDRPIKKISYPNYKKSSSLFVRQYLAGELGPMENISAGATSMFYAVDRYISYLKEWKDDYDNGTIIVADRYVQSNIIYQMPKLQLSQYQDFMQWALDTEYYWSGLPKPDVVIYLDMDIEVSQKLLTQRYKGDESKKDIHEANIPYMYACRNAAITVSQALEWKTVKCNDSDFNPFSKEKIAEEVLKIAKEYI